MKILLLFLALFTSVLAAEEWKLQPLKYNNPGLMVDLGVGLWAWPLPMDYDRDGDYDLVVACPDKPSNGFYFFENTTQDPKVKLPVFKAGVFLGKTGQNVQVSYVGGEARVLQEHSEYVDFRENGFSKLEKIHEGQKFIEGNTRAKMWRYVDWEGDGDQDLIAGIGDWSDYEWDHAYDAQGRWRNGPLHGWVFLMKNNDGKFAEPVKVTAAGSPVDVYGWPSPNFADFDNDGDLDLLCGEFLDGFTYFQNIGSRSEPEYAAGLKLNGEDGEPLVMHLQMITPTAIDWDRDGDYDLIVGDEDGRVALVENVSPRANKELPGVPIPVFKQPVYFQQEADTLKFGALATPYAHDWDKDGDEDIVCGNTAGNIAVFENLDGKGTKWAAPELLKVDGKDFRIMAGDSGSIQGPAEAKWGYTTLSAADWDGDDFDDVLVNSIWPKLQLLRNSKEGFTEEPLPFWTSESPPDFFWWQTKAENLQTQWRTTPVATDFDGDGELDLVILDQEGYLTCQSRAREVTRIFFDEDGNPIRLNPKSAGGSGRTKIDIVDWDGDGRLDVLVNSENAAWYRNCEGEGNQITLKKVGNLAKRNVAGHTSSPSACDFDKNGKPDLLVGSENGRIYFIRHEDCVQFTKEEITARPPMKIPAPRFPGLVSEDFVFTNAKFPQCHASTICETTRGQVCAWFGGTKEKAKDVGIWVSYNDGAGWSEPREFANGVQHEGLRYPCWNPVLFQPPGDAPTMLFFKVGPTPSKWWGEVMVSYDRGRTFRDRRRLPEGIDGPVRCKPVLIGDTLLCGGSTEYDGWRVHFEKLNLTNNKWKRIGPINSKDEFNAIQPTILQHADGRRQALCRTKESVITSSFSEDSGETWSKMEAIDMPNPNAGIDVVTLKDGRFLMIYNHLRSNFLTGWGNRGMLNLAISDDGIAWKKVTALEQEKGQEFSYPAIIQGDDGLVHISYTWKRTRIKHVVVDPAKLQTGEVLTKGAWPE